MLVGLTLRGRRLVVTPFGFGRVEAVPYVVAVDVAVEGLGRRSASGGGPDASANLTGDAPGAVNVATPCHRGPRLPSRSDRARCARMR